MFAKYKMLATIVEHTLAPIITLSDEIFGLK